MESRAWQVPEKHCYLNHVDKAKSKKHDKDFSLSRSSAGTQLHKLPIYLTFKWEGGKYLKGRKNSGVRTENVRFLAACSRPDGTILYLFDQRISLKTSEPRLTHAHHLERLILNWVPAAATTGVLSDPCWPAAQWHQCIAVPFTCAGGLRTGITRSVYMHTSTNKSLYEDHGR